MRHGNMFIQYLAHMSYQLIHCKIRLIDIIIDIISFLLILNQKIDKCHNIPDISHRFFIFPFSHHDKFSSGNLFQQIINIPPVPFSKNNCRP